MPTDLRVSRTKQVQPDVKKTKKSTKHYQAKAEYDNDAINNEFDFIHERINSLFVEDAALDDLAAGATLAETITRVNSLTETLRKAGLLKRS